jgi:hypothetical protein
MAVTIVRTPWFDDDGTGTTGTVINNAVKTALYNDIDGALAKVAQLNGGNAFVGTQIGDFKLSGDYYEKSRATPVGHWIDIPFSAANFGTSAGGTWTVTAQTAYAYTLVGKTLWLTLEIPSASSSVTVAAGGLTVALPPGFSSVRPTSGTVLLGLGAGPTYETGTVLLSGAVAIVYRAGLAAFAVGAVRVTMTVPVVIP